MPFILDEDPQTDPRRLSVAPPPAPPGPPTLSQGFVPDFGEFVPDPEPPKTSPMSEGSRSTPYTPDSAARLTWETLKQMGDDFFVGIQTPPIGYGNVKGSMVTIPAIPESGNPYLDASIGTTNAIGEGAAALLTPMNAVIGETLGIAHAAHKVGSRLGGMALSAAGGYFTGDMTKAAAEQAGRSSVEAGLPQTSTAEAARLIATPVITGTMAALPLVGGAVERMGEPAKRKAPAEAAPTETIYNRPMPETAPVSDAQRAENMAQPLPVPENIRHLVEVVSGGDKFSDQHQRGMASRGVDPNNVDGFYDPSSDKVILNDAQFRLPDGTIWQDKLNEKIAHEAFVHLGLRPALGEGGMTKLGKQIFDSLNDKERDDVAKNNGIKVGADGGESHVGEEWLAYKAEDVLRRGTTDTVWSKIADTIRSSLRAIGINLRLSDTEVAAYVAKGKRGAELENRRRAKEGTDISSADSDQFYQWIGDRLDPLYSGRDEGKPAPSEDPNSVYMSVGPAGEKREPVFIRTKNKYGQGDGTYRTADGLYEISKGFVGNFMGYEGVNKENAWNISKRNAEGVYESAGPGKYRTLADAIKAAKERHDSYGYDHIGYTVAERNAWSKPKTASDQVRMSVSDETKGSRAERIRNFNSAANDVLQRTTYGDRTVDVPQNPFLLQWSNANKKWYAYESTLKPGEIAKVNSSEMLVSAKDKAEADLMAEHLPEHPLYQASDEAGRSDPNAQLKWIAARLNPNSAAYREIESVVGKEAMDLARPDLSKNLNAFMDATAPSGIRMSVSKQGEPRKYTPEEFIRESMGDTAENLRLKHIRRPGSGDPVNPAVPFTDAKGRTIAVGGDEAHGGKPFELWKREMEQWGTPEEIKKWSEWYDELHKEFVAQYGEKEAGTQMIAWLSGQQSASPSSAMGNVFRVEDRLAGIGTGKKGGLPDKKIEGILTHTPPEEGFGAKLSDFVDSGLGKDTRSYMGDKPEGGKPFVADIWTGRDRGHIDQQTISRLYEMAQAGNLYLNGKPVEAKVTKWKTLKDGDKTTEVPRRLLIKPADGKPFGLEVDLNGSPSGTVYEGTSEWGQRLTDHLNSTNWMGGNWEPKKVQAAGWMRAIRQYGREGESVDSALQRNTQRVYSGVNYGSGSMLPATLPDFGKLHPDAQRTITKDMLEWAVPQLVQKIGGSLRLRQIATGDGVWGGTRAPSVAIEVIGSDAAKSLFRQAMAYVGEQAATIGVEFGKGGEKSRVISFGKQDGTKFTDAEIESLLKEAEISGLSAHQFPGGEQAVITGADANYMPKAFTDKQAEALAKKIDTWAVKHGIDVDVHDSPGRVFSDANDYKNHPNGEKYLDALRGGGIGVREQSIVDFRNEYRNRLKSAIDAAQQKPGSAAAQEARLSVSKKAPAASSPPPATGWVLPNGEYAGAKGLEFNTGDWHGGHLAQNMERYKQAFGITSPDRLDALKKGFIRLRYDGSTGRLGIEGKVGSLRGRILDKLSEIVEMNLNKLDRIDINLFNEKGAVAKQAGESLFRLSGQDKSQAAMDVLRLSVDKPSKLEKDINEAMLDKIKSDGSATWKTSSHQYKAVHEGRSNGLRYLRTGNDGEREFSSLEAMIRDIVAKKQKATSRGRP